MPKIGGQTTFSGTKFQAEITTLYLGRLLDTRVRGDDAMVIEVRPEADAAAKVDDILVRFKDGHTEWMQVKENLKDSPTPGGPWEKMWHHFEDQLPLIQNARDRIVLVLGYPEDWSKNLKEVCERAEGTKNGLEWLQKGQLSVAQRGLLKSLYKLLYKAHIEDIEDHDLLRLYDLMRRIDVRVLETDFVRQRDGPNYMPASNYKPLDLFDKLFVIVQAAAEKGKSIDRQWIMEKLANEQVEIYSSGEEGVDSQQLRETQIRKVIGDYRLVFLPRARKQAGRFINETQGGAAHPGVYIPTIYVHRQQVESQLKEFVNSTEPIIILTGDSGVGKTNLLCQWAQDLLGADESVIMYNCANLLNTEFENYIVQDLSLTNTEDLLPALCQISKQASVIGKQFFIIFDNLYGYHGADKTGPYNLLRHIDEFVRNPNFPEKAVRIVISCSTATFKCLERQDPLSLEWVYQPPYYQPGKEQVVSLGIFTDEEFKTAYGVYKTYFQLPMPFDKLTEALCQRLRTPVLLRMFAETYQGKPESIAYEPQALGVLRHYYEDRVKRVEDRNFVDKLASEMYRKRRSSLSLDELSMQDNIKTDILDKDPDSSYIRMLEQGILTVTAVPLLGDEVRFTQSRFGAFALAVQLWRQHQEIVSEAILKDLIGETASSFMTWDAAITLLLLSKELGLFLSCAKSQSMELRELVIQALVELYADEPDNSVELIKSLINSSSQEAHRSGLKAVYWIGPGAQEVFLWAVSNGSDELRRATKDILYLIWCQDSDFAFGLMNELANRIGLKGLRRLRTIMEFLIDLSITIYINHPENEKVIQLTTDLWYKILVDRLHLNLLKTDLFGKKIENLLFQIVGRGFTGRLLDTVLFTEFVPADRFFNLPELDRERFKKSVTLIDPKSDIQNQVDNLQTLLESEIIIFNILASLVLASHAYTNFSVYQKLLEDLWDRLTPQGKVWELMSFAVLLPDTPPEWSELLETFTRQLIEEYPAIFYGDEMPLVQKYDVLMFPLGISYGKHGKEMPYYLELLHRAIRLADRRLVQRSLAGLGLVGFYYPQAVFQTLRKSVPDFKDPAFEDDLIRPLATIRTLHLEDVDNFMNRIGASEAFQHRVSAATDVELIKRYIYSLGIYNNSVHQAIYYPIMRRELLIDGLTALVDSSSPQDFIGRYSVVPLRMLRVANFRLDKWTLP